jgi:hypothetical protein
MGCDAVGRRDFGRGGMSNNQQGISNIQGKNRAVGLSVLPPWIFRVGHWILNSIGRGGMSNTQQGISNIQGKNRPVGLSVLPPWIFLVGHWILNSGHWIFSLSSDWFMSAPWNVLPFQHF